MRTTPQPSSPSSDKDAKLWAGQLYLSHTSEIVAKLLYKKFYRKTDCTILYGKWTTILRQQAAMLSDDSSLNDSVSGSISVSQSGSIKVHKRHASAEDNNWRAGRRFSDSTLFISDEFDQLPTILEDEEPAPMRDSFEAVTSPLPKRITLFPQSPLVASRIGNGDTLKRMRSAKYRVSSPTMSRSNSYATRAGGYATDCLIASSRGGVINPREIEPIQCFVMFYTSCWSIPHSEARKLKKIFGPTLVPKIERYIRDRLNGEQCPGTSILLETDCLPCKYIVCTSVARNQSLLSQDYAYNSFRSALQAIHSFNKQHLNDQITSILCPALECITSSPYNLVHQMVTCYEYWDWHIYASGAVLPLGHADTDIINKEIQLTAPSIPKIAEDLEQYMWAGMLGARGLVYEVELNILLFWLDQSNKGMSKKLPGVHRPTLPKYIIAQVLIDILKKPDTPPFTITPTQIYSGISGGALEYILELAIEGQVKIYDDILLKELELGETLAHGTSGKVAKAKWQDMDVAVKFFNSYQPQVFRNELTLITLARHPKLVQAFGGHCTERETYIVTELLDMNLYQLLQKRTLDYNSKIKIALDVAEAVEFLHSRGIVHRDLKSVNVLLNLGHDICAKVCDFGLSRVVDDINTMTGNVGTVAWIAPEIFQNKKYSDKCDVYSFGILLYELITQLLPFKDLVSFKIPLAVMKGQRPVIPNDIVASTPKEYIMLMKQCWHENGSKRPSFAQIITRLTAMQPEKMSSSFLSTTEDDTTTDMSVTTVSDEASSSATYSAMDLDTPIMEELRVALKTRGHNKLVTEELLSKTLLAKKGKVPLAKKVIKSYLEWYQILNEGKPLQISDVRNTLEDRIIFVPQNASDKEGRSIIYWDAAKHNVDSISEPEFIKGLVYCLERVTERSELHAKGIVIVGNFTGWTMANFSTRVMNSFFGTLRKHFPLILHKVFFVNPPPWISKVITMCQSFISSIMSQIEITSSAKLQDHISPENLFPCMNGSFSFDVDQWIRSRYEIEGVEYL